MSKQLQLPPGEPTEATLANILRYSELSPQVARESGAPHGGVVVPNGMPYRYLPNDLVDLIVQARGPRTQAPRELVRLARQRRVFLEGHSLKWRNAATNQALDLSRVHSDWWAQFNARFEELESRQLMGSLCTIEKREIASFVPRSDADSPHRIQWLAEQETGRRDFAHKFAFDDDSSSLGKRFCNFMELNIFDDSQPFESLDAWLNSQPMLELLELIPDDLLSPSAGFGATAKHLGNYRGCLKVFLFGRDLVRAASARRPLFDATSEWRQAVLRSRGSLQLSQKESAAQAAVATTDAQVMLLGSSNFCGNVHLRTDAMRGELRARKQYWTRLFNVLADWRAEDIHFNILLLQLEPELQEARFERSAENCAEAERQASLHFELTSIDLSSPRFWHGSATAMQTDDIQQFLLAYRPWHVVKIELVNDGAEVEWSDEQMLAHAPVIKLGLVFPQFLQLSDEQLSVVVERRPSSEPCVSLLIFSPEYIEATKKAKAERDEKQRQTSGDSTITSKLLANLRRFKAKRSRLQQNSSSGGGGSSSSSSNDDDDDEKSSN